MKALQPGTTLGDIVYSSATANTSTRLPIGTNGYILTVASGVPSWAAAAGAPANWTLITSGSLSSTSTTVSSISGSYDDLRIVFRSHRSSTDAANMYIVFNATDNIYNGSIAFNKTGTADTYNMGDPASTESRIATNIDNAVFNDNTTIVEMPFYSNSSLQKSADVYGNTYRADVAAFNWMMYKNRIGITAAITGFTLYASAGNLSGSYYVYGL